VKRKNKKAQMNTGLLIVLFITIIVGVVLFQAIAQTVEPIRNTISVTNVTYTVGANGAKIDLEGQEIFGTPLVTNASGIKH